MTFQCSLSFYCTAVHASVLCSAKDIKMSNSGVGLLFEVISRVITSGRQITPCSHFVCLSWPMQHSNTGHDGLRLENGLSPAPTICWNYRRSGDWSWYRLLDGLAHWTTLISISVVLSQTCTSLIPQGHGDWANASLVCLSARHESGGRPSTFNTIRQTFVAVRHRRH